MAKRKREGRSPARWIPVGLFPPDLDQERKGILVLSPGKDAAFDRAWMRFAREGKTDETSNAQFHRARSSWILEGAPWDAKAFLQKWLRWDALSPRIPAYEDPAENPLLDTAPRDPCLLPTAENAAAAADFDCEGGAA